VDRVHPDDEKLWNLNSNFSESHGIRPHLANQLHGAQSALILQPHASIYTYIQAIHHF